MAKKHKTFKTPMMDNCNNNFKKNLKEKFEVAFVGLNIKNGKYALGSDKGDNDAMLQVEGSKMFTIENVLNLVNHINDYMPEVCNDEFTVTVDNIEFHGIIIPNHF